MKSQMSSQIGPQNELPNELPNGIPNELPNGIPNGLPKWPGNGSRSGPELDPKVARNRIPNWAGIGPPLPGIWNLGCLALE